MKRIFRRIILLLVLIAAIAVGAVASLHMPFRGFQGEKFVQIDHGKGTSSIAEMLEDAGVIRYKWQFWVARMLNPEVKLQAGEYRFADAASVQEVFARIGHGDVYHFDFTIPEGSNIFDIGRLLDEAGIMTSEDFLHAASDPADIHDLVPQAKTLEGYLFPSTYRIQHSTTAAQLCSLMTNEFRKKWKSLAASDPSADPKHVVTLASLVEKETGVPTERAVVAGVFENRLNKGMRLGCDPTVVYAALTENRYRGTIYRSDLDNQNPYNTYQHAGLPPGPIANPGMNSLDAALHPAQTDFLYFVAKPEGGGHNFSTTLAGHEKAVQSYRHGPTTKAPTKSTRKAG